LVIRCWFYSCLSSPLQSPSRLQYASYVRVEDKLHYQKSEVCVMGYWGGWGEAVGSSKPFWLSSWVTLSNIFFRCADLIYQTASHGLWFPQLQSDEETWELATGVYASKDGRTVLVDARLTLWVMSLCQGALLAWVASRL
jgi:hypothetical protein